MMPDCPDMALPMHVMQHVMRVESSFNPYAIGVVGGRLERQPRNLPEAVATARMLEKNGFNFSLGLAQVNRYNLARYGLHTYEKAFGACDNVRAGSRILRECYQRANDWGKALSCYYSGNFVTGFRHGYVQKVMASMAGTLTSAAGGPAGAQPIPVFRRAARASSPASPTAPSRAETARASVALTMPSGAARQAVPMPAGAHQPAALAMPGLAQPAAPAVVPATALPAHDPRDASFVF